MWRALAFLVLLVGCDAVGSGSTADNQGSTAANPPADCDAFIAQHYCPLLVPCYPDLTQASCVAAAQTSIDCSAAVGESGALSTCEAQLDGETCDELTSVAGTVTLPESCQGAFF
jgi:hypothetical protein